MHLSLDLPLNFMWLGKETTLSPDWIHYSRRLNEYELIIVDEGTLYIADEKKHYTVERGNYLLMPPCEHQYGWKPSSCSFYWLHFDFDRKPPAETPGALSFPPQGKIEHFPAVQTILSQIFHNEQFYSDTRQCSFLLSALLLELYNQTMYGYVTPQNHLKSSRVSLPKEDLCHKVKNYIRWNRTHCIKISEIANYLCYSEKYISSTFAEVTGIRLKNYIDEQQMEAAKELLANSNLSIREIAFLLGYTDSHNFSRIFKRVTGMAPFIYRNSSGKNNIRP